MAAMQFTSPPNLSLPAHEIHNRSGHSVWIRVLGSGGGYSGSTLLPGDKYEVAEGVSCSKLEGMYWTKGDPETCMCAIQIAFDPSPCLTSPMVQHAWQCMTSNDSMHCVFEAEVNVICGLLQGLLPSVCPWT